MSWESRTPRRGLLGLTGPMDEARRLEALLRGVIASADGGAIREFLSEDANEDVLRDLLRPIATVTGLDVRWVAVNESRVDAGLTGSGREWRLVATVDDRTRIQELWVHEKPTHFDGVPGGRIVVLNGPSGSGKSSVMTAMMEMADTPWVVFDEPWLGTVAQPYLIWRDVSPTLHAGYLSGIAALAGAGNQVALSSGGLSYADVRTAFANLATTYVGLDCPLEVLLERERGRPGRWGGLAEASIGDHADWTYDLRFDTSTSSPAEVAMQVLTAVAGDDAIPA